MHPGAKEGPSATIPHHGGRVGAGAWRAGRCKLIVRASTTAEAYAKAHKLGLSSEIEVG
jgi:hypothetical protein